MIKFDQNSKTFLLTNNSIMLLLYINSMGGVENIYFGKFDPNVSIKNRIRIPDIHLFSYYSNKDNKEFFSEDGISDNFSCFEVAPHSLGDKRPAPLIIQKEDGNFETSLIYKSHKIYNGYPAYKEGPHAHDGKIETLEITYFDEFDNNVIVKQNISIDKEKDIIVKNFEISNLGNSSIRLLRALSMQLDLTSNEYEVSHFGGTWGRERNLFRNNIIDGEQIVSSNYGRSSHEENPFFFLSKKGADEAKGEVIGFNLIYSGNFKISLFSDYKKMLRVNYGINDFNFCWNLKKGETFITPQAVISYSYSGIDKMSQTFHKFVRENIITYKEYNDYKPIIFNSWEGCLMDFDTNSIISYIDDSCKIGAELFVLDDGWFGQRNNDSSSLGDWIVNKKKIDLAKVISHCHSKGLKFGLWFEPEMVNPDSDLFRKHKDYSLGYTRENQLLQRHQLMLDFSNPEVVDHIFNMMSKIIDEYELDYIKWDHNRDMKECFVPRLGKDGQGEVAHRYVLGYYSLIERINKKYPNIMIEGCSSGGGRFDLGTLFYCPQIWTSDNTNPSARINIQYNTSFGYPLSTISSHVSNSSDSSYKVKSQLALFGSYGYEMNPNNLTVSEIEEIKPYADIYKKYHLSIFEQGETFHLSSFQDNSLLAWLTVNQSKNKAFLILMMKKDIKPSINFLKIRGLKENTDYIFSYEGKQESFNSSVLVNKGFSLEPLIKLEDDFSYKGILIEITEKN